MDYKTTCALALGALLTAGSASAARLDIITRNELAELVSTSGKAVFLAKYCELPTSGKQLIETKAAEALAFGTRYLTRAEGTFDVAQAAAKVQADGHPKEVDCSPQVLDHFAEHFASFVDAELSTLKKSVAD